LAVHTSGADTLVLVKPLTFMNRSGEVIADLRARYGAAEDDLLVVFDQMDLPPGRTRIKPHGSHAGHNGLRSVESALASDRYHRLAVGIGRPEAGTSVIDHVLGRPSDADRAAVDAALDRVVPEVNLRWNRGWEALFDAVNQRVGRAP